MITSSDKPQIGRALSALLQCVLASELAGTDGAVGAMVQEYADDLALAQAGDPWDLADFWHDAWCNMACAALALLSRDLESGGDPREFLPELIRGRRREDRS